MKRIFSIVAGTVFAATGALALPQVTVNDGPGSPGGIFNAFNAGLGNFQSFCLETTETLNLGGTYYYTDSFAAVRGSQPVSDPISRATAYLFRNFQTILPGYVNDAAHNNDIQQAIWFLEGESLGVANAYSAAAIAHEGASWNNDANGAYGVIVMNLWGDENQTQFKQDIMRVPDGGLTLALLGMAMGGLGAISRRIRK